MFRWLIVATSLLAPSIASAVTIESRSSSEPHPGITIIEGTTSSPRTNFYAAVVSLCDDDVHVDASDYGSARTSASWGSSVGAELAVNGDFYTSSPRTHVYGDAVSGGARWATNRSGVSSEYSSDWYYGRYGWIAFGDGWVEHTNSRKVKVDDLSANGWQPETRVPDPREGTRALVSGFPQLVVDGEPVTCSSPTASSCFSDRSDMQARHPRTAMGLSQDRQQFYLVVVDGRSSASVGMYGTELADLMHKLGAHTAFNLDGGGSSQMWVRGRGTINNPSDGSPRSVVNHWGVFAGGGNGLPKLPGSCDNSWDGLLHNLPGQVRRTTDLNGDGLGDACIRTEDGLECSLFEDGAFGPPIAGPAIGHGTGWGDVANYSTMRWGDINGDGRADLCARANAGMRCWTFDGTEFSASIAGPEFADDDGYDDPSLYTTIRLADVNGDGLDDICGRWTDGYFCYPSTGDGFGEAIAGPQLSDANGWRRPEKYGTIRTGDVNGDGKDDVCGRNAAGMRCWLTDGERIDGPAWSNNAGWDNHRNWSSIRLVDLDNDGRADLCGRGPDGIECALSTVDGFGDVITGPAWADDGGWNDSSNYSTLRFADVTGDGILDACARANAGIRCVPFDGTAFGETIATEIARDETGWANPFFHRTIDFVDLDADGKADICARASRGVVCWRSTGDGFEETLLEGPAWSNEAGFKEKKYYGTLAFLGNVRPVPVDEDPTEPAEPTDPSTPGTSDNPADPNRPGTPEGDATDNPSTNDPMMPEDMVIEGRSGGCSTAGGAGSNALLLLVLGLFWRRRRQ